MGSEIPEKDGPLGKGAELRRKVFDRWVEEGVLKSGEAARIREGGKDKPLADIADEIAADRRRSTGKVLKGLADVLGVKAVDVSQMDPEPDVVAILPVAVCRRHRCLAFHKEEGLLMVAMADPADLMVIEDIQLRTGLDVHPYLALPSAILRIVEPPPPREELVSMGIEPDEPMPTIVGPQPRGRGRVRQPSLGGLEELLIGISESGVSAEKMLADPVEAADEAGIELTPVERTILESIPRESLAQIIAVVREDDRRLHRHDEWRDERSAETGILSEEPLRENMDIAGITTGEPVDKAGMCVNLLFAMVARDKAESVSLEEGPDQIKAEMFRDGGNEPFPGPPKRFFEGILMRLRQFAEMGPSDRTGTIRIKVKGEEFRVHVSLSGDEGSRRVDLRFEKGGPPAG